MAVTKENFEETPYWNSSKQILEITQNTKLKFQKIQREMKKVDCEIPLTQDMIEIEKYIKENSKQKRA